MVFRRGRKNGRRFIKENVNVNMPKLIDVEEKSLFGLKVDKENDEVFFNDEKHEYRNKKDGSKYISVTTLIHDYQTPYDSNFWSSYKACEALMDQTSWTALKPILLQTKIWNDKFLTTYKINESDFQKKKQEILNSYEEKRNKSCEIGTAIHLEKELEYYNGEPDVKKFGLGGKFVCEKGHYQLDLDKGVYPEFLISHDFGNGLRISGQLDMFIKDGNDIYIYDYKTNDSIDKQSYFDRKTKTYQMLKYPLNNIMDCNFMIYSLQLSTYFYLLKQKNPDFVLKKLALIHIDKSTRKETVYECEYLEEDVKRMLKHHQVKIAQTDVINRDKPIVF